MLKVAIDARALTDGSELRGIGTYTRRLIAGLAATPDLYPIVLAEAHARVPGGVERVTIKRRTSHWALKYREHDLLLARDLARVGADVNFGPAQHPPRHTRAPHVQTVHDLIPLHFDRPEMAASRKRWATYGPRLRDSAAVITDAQFTAEDIVGRFGIERTRIHVIPLAADESFTRHDEPGGPPTTATPYVLAVGGWSPQKGTAEAVAVSDRIVDAGLPHRLVIAGNQDDTQRQRLRAEIAASAHPKSIEVRGYVEDLVGLYRGASLVLVTSRFEGFGLPAVEAMASATPVVSFSNSTLTEVVAEGGILVPDGDVEAAADAAIDVLRDEDMWRLWSRRGHQRSRQFSWEKTVSATAEVLRLAARSS